VERQFGKSWLASAGYIGNGGYHLSSTQNNSNGSMQGNPALYIPGQSTVANTQARRPYPALGPVTIYTTDYNSHYHSLQFSLERRFSHGLAVMTNYTWSKEMDNYSPSKNLSSNPFNRNFDWGLSGDNVPHLFHLSFIWQIPVRLHGAPGALLNGWQVTGLSTWQCGLPFTVFSGIDNSLSGSGLDRADFIGTSLSDAKLSGLSHQNEVRRAFNTSLFVRNAAGTFGNAGKNILRAPRTFNTDLGLIKNTKITERISGQLRAEFFNAFNNVNFGAPGGTVGTPAFGQINSASDPRIVQLAVKLIF
jgi:hypothetical protein